MQPIEEWRPVVGYEGAYEVSSLGRVRSLDRVIIRSTGAKHPQKGKVLRGYVTLAGYRGVSLGRDRRRPIHQLVLEAFAGPRPSPGHVARHLDGNPANNAATNLCWGTQSENVLDEVRHGTHNNASKTHCPRGHEYTTENIVLVEGGRQCRECGRDRGRDYQREKREAQRVADGKVLHESASKRSASGVRGVHWEPLRGAWSVHCCYRRKRYFLGRYSDMAEAEAVAIVARAHMSSDPAASRVAEARARLTPEGIRQLARHGFHHAKESDE